MKVFKVFIVNLPGNSTPAFIFRLAMTRTDFDDDIDHYRRFKSLEKNLRTGRFFSFSSKVWPILRD